MARLIDADAMKEELLWGNVYLSDNETNALVDLIENQPTIDPESLRPRSYWTVPRGGGLTMGKKIIFPDINKQVLKIVKYNLENPDVTISEKTEAIKRVAEMRTHDNLTKADLIFALRWLFRHYDFLEE